MSTGASATTSPRTSSATTSPAGSPTTSSPPACSTPPASRTRSSASCRDVDPGWTAFYRNTLAALRDGGEPGGTNAGMAPVHDRAAALARRPARRRARLLLRVPVAAARRRGPPGDGRRPRPRARRGCSASVAPALGRPVTALAGDARRIPLATRQRRHRLRGAPARAPARAGSTPSCSPRCCGWRAAAPSSPCPFEDEPTPAWGHVRTFDLDDLDALGAATGLPYAVDEHHGGWLVIDS